MSHIQGEGKLVRIFIGESDRLDGKLLRQTIVLAARDMGLAGATVLRGVGGFGARSALHTTRLLRLSQDLPIIIEVVDLEEKIGPFVERVQELLDRANCGGLITLERAEVIRYSPDRER